MLIYCLSIFFSASFASAQMSESPVGVGFKDPGRSWGRYIPPPPVISQKPAPKAPPSQMAKPVRVQPVQRSIASEPAVAPAPVRRPFQTDFKTQMAQVQSSSRATPRTESAPVRHQPLAPAPTPVRQAPVVMPQTPPPRRVAANTYTSEAYLPRVRTSSPSNERRHSAPSNWTISGFYNLARETAYSGNTNVSGSAQSFSATESSAPGLGISGAYVSRPYNGLGWSGQLDFEYNRTATNLTGEANGHSITSDYGSGYSTNTFTAASNLSYSIGGVYFYGGLNYPFITGSSAVHLTGLPGYQAGFGYGFTRRFSIHTEYRTTRMKGTLEMPPTRLEVGEASMRGFILAVDFSL